MKWAVGYVVGAWALDVVVLPALMAKEARRAARGRPVLNVGAGTPGSSLRVALLGPTLWGDVNCDLAGPCPGVTYCDAHALPYPDKSFGAAIASHLLEHVEDPEVVLRELHRVADRVFIYTPSWWGLHTWTQPQHLWYRRKDGRFMRLRPRSRS